VLKLDADGDVQWGKTYGGASGEDAEDIQHTTDGGYVVLAETSSFGAGAQDFWVLKLDPYGNIEWQRTYGGPGDEDAQPIIQTIDGGYIIAGATPSFGVGGEDLWVVKLSASGNIEWEKTYGGIGDDEAISVGRTCDGGYIVAGETTSFGAGGTDLWVLKLDPNGNVPICGLIGASAGTVTNTAAAPANTNVVGVNTAATVTDTAVVPVNTAATVSRQCPP